MQYVSAVSPNGAGASTIDGNRLLSTTRPAGFLVYTTSTSSTTNVAALNITSGRGVLRFLSFGLNSATGAGYLTVVVNGVTVINDLTVSSSVGSGFTPAFNRAVVGTLAHHQEGTQYAVSVVPAEYGWLFTTSLQVYIRHSTGATSTNCAFAYTVY